MDKVLIADIGLEGGGAMIYGRQQDGTWFFWLEGTSMDLDENDDEVWRSWESEPVQDLALALPKEWPLFYPSKLNPEFLDWFRKNYDKSCSQLSEDLQRSQREHRHPDWMRLLYGWTEKDLDIKKPDLPFLLDDFRCGLTRLAISPDSRTLLTANGQDGAIRLWDLTSRKLIFCWDSSGSPAQFVRKGTAILYVDPWGIPCLVDLLTYSTIHRLEDAPRGIRHAVLSPYERFMATGGADRSVRIWEMRTGKEIGRYELYPKKSGVNYVAWSPDGRFIAACGYPRTIRIWEVATGKHVFDLEGHKHGVHSIAFSPDGTRLLSGSSDRTMRLWDVTNGRELQRFKGHTAWVNAVAFAPDGRSPISAGDTSVRLWDTNTGAETCRLGTHQGTVSDVVVTPDGNQVISAGDDGVKHWKCC